jgi:hypothetical protein
MRWNFMPVHFNVDLIDLGNIKVNLRYSRPPAPVFETTDFTNPPPFLQPSRPLSGPPNNYRPISVPRPDGPGPDFARPGNSGILTNPDGPRPGGPGILTGPVPSWEQRPGDKFAYKDYEHCKCAYSFNCASPGIKFVSTLVPTKMFGPKVN